MTSIWQLLVQEIDALDGDTGVGRSVRMTVVGTTCVKVNTWVTRIVETNVDAGN